MVKGGLIRKVRYATKLEEIRIKVGYKRACQPLEQANGIETVGALVQFDIYLLFPTTPYVS